MTWQENTAWKGNFQKIELSNKQERWSTHKLCQGQYPSYGIVNPTVLYLTELSTDGLKIAEGTETWILPEYFFSWKYIQLGNAPNLTSIWTNAVDRLQSLLWAPTASIPRSYGRALINWKNRKVILQWVPWHAEVQGNTELCSLGHRLLSRDRSLFVNLETILTARSFARGKQIGRQHSAQHKKHRRLVLDKIRKLNVNGRGSSRAIASWGNS